MLRLSPWLWGALLLSIYGTVMYVEARSTEAAIAYAREEQSAIIADYESALFQAQKEYDALTEASSLAIAKLEAALQIQDDTLAWYREALDTAKAERDRYKLLAGYRSN
jgi:hypothetical protein